MNENASGAVDASVSSTTMADFSDGRLTNRIEFVAFMEAVVPRDNLGEPLRAMGVAAYPKLRAEIEAGEVEVYKSGIGRGADAEAIALVVVAASGAIYVAAQAAEKILDVALKAAELWEKLRDKRGKVVLSIGTVKALCLADLHRQIGNLDDVFFVWTGDIGGGLNVDAGHTGEDIFLVHLARVRLGEGRSWLYVVDSHGRVLQRTSFVQHPATYGKIVGSFDDPPPLDLHFLLDSEGP